jgi:hypothetical protein
MRRPALQRPGRAREGKPIGHGQGVAAARDRDELDALPDAADHHRYEAHAAARGAAKIVRQPDLGILELTRARLSRLQKFAAPAVEESYLLERRA